MTFKVKNVGKRSAVLYFKGKIVGTLINDRHSEYSEDVVDGYTYRTPAEDRIVISGVSVGSPLNRLRHSNPASRGPAPRWDREPTLEEMAAELLASEEYEDGEQAVWDLRDGDLVPTEGSDAFLKGVKTALALRKRPSRNGITAEEKFRVVKGVARIKPAPPRKD